MSFLYDHISIVIYTLAASSNHWHGCEWKMVKDHQKSDVIHEKLKNRLECSNVVLHREGLWVILVPIHGAPLMIQLMFSWLLNQKSRRFCGAEGNLWSGILIISSRAKLSKLCNYSSKSRVICRPIYLCTSHRLTITDSANKNRWCEIM